MKLIKATLALVVCYLFFGELYAQFPQEIETRMSGSASSIKIDIKIFEKLVIANPNAALKEGLADCYLRNGEPESAEKAYKSSMDQGNSDPNCLLKYAWVLQRNNKFSEALEAGEEYGRLTGKKELVTKLLQPSFYAKSGNWVSGKYEVNLLKSINTKESDVVAFCDWKDFYFYSKSRRREIVKNKSLRRKNRRYALYSAGNQNGDYKENVVVNSRNVGDEVVDLGMSITTDKKAFLVTRPRIGEGGRNANTGEIPSIQGIKELRQNENGELGEGYLFENITTEDPCFHPAIDPHGKYLVFASLSEGGFGKSDLYVSFREGDSWTAPRNLGSGINTPGDEYFPTFDGSGHLYFASDGHKGFGGLDIFSAKKIGDEWGNPENLGNEINSMYDEFGMVWEPASKGNTGFFNSNRHPLNGDDIYSFRVRPQVSGLVKDEYDASPIEGASVVFEDLSGVKRTRYTDHHGATVNFVDANREYKVSISAFGFLPKDTIISTTGLLQGSDLVYNIALEKESRFFLHISAISADNGLWIDSSRVTIHDLTQRRPVVKNDLIGKSQEYRLKTGRKYTILVRKPGYLSQVFHRHIPAKRGVANDSLVAGLKAGEEFLLEGIVTGVGGEKDHLVSGGKVSILDEVSEAVLDSTISFEGRFIVALDRNKVENLSVFTAANGYLTDRQSVKIEPGIDSRQIIVALDKVQYGLGNLVATVTYPYDAASLKLVSRQELSRIYYFLDQNEEAKLAVRSHTDSRGSASYNYILSQRRSQAVISYIRARRPIPVSKFSTEDFGEYYLLNDCKDGIPCTEEEHEVNRRTELYFLLETPYAAEE
jgi:outer membrane protein OmpA-like peptidoglycan-associated protein